MTKDVCMPLSIKETQDEIVSQKIKNLDASTFERFALAFLHKKYPRQTENLNHTGMNVNGETIADPVDALGWYKDGATIVYTSAAFTVYDRRQLRSKWLGEDGDVIKVLQKANEVRKISSNVSFCLFLCCNDIPSSELLLDVKKSCDDQNINVTIVTNSVLREFVTFSPEGQLLAQRYLGFEANLLSNELLQEICQKSIAAYKDENPNAYYDQCVETSLLLDLKNLLLGHNIFSVFLEGHSGAGKSVLCYQILKNITTYGLWMQPDCIESASNIQEAISNSLKKFHPSLESDSGTKVLSFLSVDTPLHIVVDDINKYGQKLIEKIINWSHKDLAEKTPYITLIVPVWNGKLELCLDKKKQDAKVAVFSANEINLQDAIAILRNRLELKRIKESSEQLESIVRKLQHDPILLDFYATLKENGQTIENPAVVVEEYIKSELRRFAGLNTVSPSVYLDICNYIARQMLEKHHFVFSARDILLHAEYVNGYEQLRNCSAIFHNSINGLEENTVFRHDRILEYFLMNAIAEMFNHFELHRDILTDPFYSEYIGQTLAKTENIDDSIINFFYTEAPACMFYGLKWISKSEQYEKYEKFTSLCKEWLNKNYSPDDFVGESWHIKRILPTINDAVVLGITEERSDEFYFCRAKHGDFNAIIKSLQMDFFLPSVNFKEWEGIINYALKMRKKQLTSSLISYLSSDLLSHSQVVAGLTFAGYLADEQLKGIVKTLWRKFSTHHNLLLYFIWAALRCNLIEDNILVDMFSFLNELEKEGGGDKLDMRHSTLRSLNFALGKFSISDQIVSFLTTNVSKLGNQTEWEVYYILNRNNNLIALKFIIQYLDAGTGDARAFTFIHDVIRHPHIWKFSSESVALLKQIGANGSKTAFQLWVLLCKSLEELKAISEQHEYYRYVAIRRMEMRDFSIIPYLKSALPTHKLDYAIEKISNVWNGELFCIIDDFLEKYFSSKRKEDGDLNYYLLRLLKHIPTSDSISLITKYWDQMKLDDNWILTAIYVGNAEIIELVEKYLLEYKSNYYFSDTVVTMTWGFGEYQEADRITKEKLQNIARFKQYLSKDAIRIVCRHCVNQNLPQSRYTFIDECKKRLNEDPTYSEIISHFAPSEIDLMNMLNDDRSNSGFIFGRTLDLCIFKITEIYGALRKWFYLAPDENKFRFICDFLLTNPQRSAIVFLNEFNNLSPTASKDRECTIYEIKLKSLQ